MDGGLFSRDFNWSDDRPEALDTGIHETDTEIIFDETSTWFDPYDFSFYLARTTPTTFTMGAASGTPNALRLVDGLADRAGFVNESVIKVGSFDFFWVGNPLPIEPIVEGDANGYNWTLTGPHAWVGVTGTVGAGKWTINEGIMPIGFAVVGSDSGPQFGDPLDTAGTIDSGVMSFADVGGSEWTIDGVTLKAKTIVNLDEWTITHNNDRVNLLHATEFFEVRKMSFEGQFANQEDRLRAGWMNPDLPLMNGLHVLERLEMYSSNAQDLLGPWAEVSELVVSKNPNDEDAPEAVLSIRHGANVFVRRDAIQPRIANPEFQLSSTLLYGIHSEQRPQQFQPHNPLSRTAFDVKNEENAPGVLAFKDQSYITAIGDNRADDPAPGELRITHGLNVQDMVMKLVGTSLAVESSVAKLPARDWYTGDVDLSIPKDSIVTLEAIAPDSCNLWFTDLPEPRCVKYWRNFTVGAGSNVVVVDECANYFIDENDQNCPCGENCVKNDKALYVVQSVLEIGSGSSLDVITNGIQLYYGEMNFTDTGTKLAFTEYGDFNVSCAVDIADYTFLPFNAKTYYEHILGPNVQTDWPVSDYDGDCDIDLIDFMAFQVAFGKTEILDCRRGNQS